MSIFDVFKKSRGERVLGSLGDNVVLAPAINITNEFARACLMRDLGALADDILQPYIFGEDIILDNAYPFVEKELYQKSQTIRDVLIQAMLGIDLVVNKVRIKNTLSNRMLLFIGLPDVVEQELREIYKEDVTMLGSSFVEKMYTEQDIKLLLLCYKALAAAYNRQDKLDRLDAKMILRMKGFHAIFTEPKNDEQESVAVENRKRLLENFEEIINGVGGVIDAEDSLGLIGGVSSSGTNLVNSVDMIYQEIARILRIPITRYLGRAPQGLNATGESDALNYDMTLDVFRSGWLEPLLKTLEIEYEKVDKIDIEYIKQVVEMMILCDIEIPQELKNKIVKLGLEL